MSEIMQSPDGELYRKPEVEEEEELDKEEEEELDEDNGIAREFPEDSEYDPVVSTEDEEEYAVEE
jgi:hypothetical protein